MNHNLLRHVRLMKKTNFIKEWPKEYIFMTKYPPLTRRSKEEIKAEPMKVPYLRLYHDAVRKNPAFASERVYPAYWHQEPMAMVLAKKQFALMQSGLDEDEAYAQAKDSVDGMESAAYDDLAELRAKVESDDSRPALLADPVITEGLAKWRDVLAETPYDELELADQGEIDHFVQAYVLKWSELERERRMGDPAFALQFEHLRNSLLVADAPMSQEGGHGHALGSQADKEDVLEFFGCTKQDLLSAREKFFFEDYASWFEKVKATPLLKAWPKAERSDMSKWIVSTLAMQHVIETEDAAGIRRYLEQLRRQFFPMINSPDTADDFDLPSAEDVRAILYKNDIGYRKEGDAGRLYVRRFYNLPRLLFPKFILGMRLKADNDKLREALTGETSLMDEIHAAGLDESALPEIRAALEEYASRTNLSGIGRDDISVLDKLLSEDGEKVPAASSNVVSSSASRRKETEIEAGTGVGDVTVSGAGQGVFMSPPTFEWDNELLDERYAHNYQVPRNKYEQDLDLVLRGSEPITLEEVQDETDMFTFNETRAENLQIMRHRMANLYDTKEAARRARNWDRAGKWDGPEVENARLDGIQ